MIGRFGRPVSELCMIRNQVIDFIYDLHGYRIIQGNPTVINSRLLEEYATAISDKGVALDNCFGEDAENCLQWAHCKYVWTSGYVSFNTTSSLTWENRGGRIELA